MVCLLKRFGNMFLSNVDIVAICDNPKQLLDLAVKTTENKEFVFDKENANKIKELGLSQLMNIKLSAIEVRDSFLTALSSNYPANFFHALDSIDALIFLMPDLTLGKHVGKNDFHDENVYPHLLRCLEVSTEFTNDPYLRLAILTHDIAKPHTIARKNDKITFHKHEVIGASLIYKWMENLRFPRKKILYVSKLVRHHQFYFQNDTTDATLVKWLHTVGKDWKDLFTLRMADRAGNIKKMQEGKHLITKEMQYLENRILSLINNQKIVFEEDLKINYNDLIQLKILDKNIRKEIISNLLGIVKKDSSKNNFQYLSNYALRYKGNKNDTSK